MIALDAEQQRAVELCVDKSKRLVAITGEAGTGKTTIIKNTCDELKRNGISFSIAAPTGKAARRIREATGYHASTLHKLLEYNRPDIDEETGEPTSVSGPSRTRGNPLDADIIVVDEYAMVPTELHRNLVSAMKPGAGLRVFGDVRQLPPIEQHELADSTSPFTRCLQMPHSVELHSIYRQAEGNGIIEVARRINKGQFFSQNGDVGLTVHDAVLYALYKSLDASDVDWKSLDNQIITPARKTDIGSRHLNGILQARWNKEMQNQIELPRNKWEQKNKLYVAIGDKVVCTVNSYDLRDYEQRFVEYREDDYGNPVGIASSYIPCPETKQMLNGEVGTIIFIDPEGVLEIDFGDRVVELPPAVSDYSMRLRRPIIYDPRKAIDLAYSLTTHKCQGSEYAHVTYLMASCAFFNLSRPNFYTGITRAHSHVNIITDQRSLAVSLKSLGFKPKKTVQSQLGSKK